MATILEFRAQSHTASHSRRGCGPAEIVFFPGVRYERWGDTPPPKPRIRKSRPRDTIELED